MKTLDEKFDEKFDVFFDNYNPPVEAETREFKHLNIDEPDRITTFTSSHLNKSIKDFYNKEIKAMLDEIVGEEEDDIHVNFINFGREEKRQEIINIIRKYGF